MKAKIITTTYYGEKADTKVVNGCFTDNVAGHETQVVNLYPQMKYQTFEGFGGAATEAAGYAMSQLSEDKYDEAVKAYFGKDGIGYRVLRTHIDSCDFSLDNYSADDDENDEELVKFSLERDEKYILPLLRRIQKEASEPVEIMLTPWSPPAYMKTNNDRNHGGKLKPEYAGRWAKYICRYISEYKKLGFKVTMLTVQNEPMAVQTWDSCIFTAEEEKLFLRDYLCPALKQNGHSDIKVSIWDHNKEIAFDRACDIIDDTTNDMISGVAFHWYTGDHFEVIGLLHEKFPDKKLIFTEGCVEYSRFAGASQLANAQMYAHDIIGNLNGGMNMFIDWNIALDEKGGPNHVGNFCDALIMCDGSKNEVEKKLSYTYMGHFSKYIQPQAVRIAFTRYTDKLELCSFCNPDNSIAAVLLNRTENDLTAYLQLGGKYQAVTVPGGSIQTVVISD